MSAMELILIRHGEGEHSLDIPRSLAIVGPRLTERGREQIANLRSEIRPGGDDILLVSPTRRTIETALILRGDCSAPAYVTPAVGPRIFPLNTRPSPLPCDTLLSVEVIAGEFPELEVRDRELWDAGINTIASERFETVGRSLIDWCHRQQSPRILMVAHDGTIHSYRQLLGEANLTRATFLGLAGWHQVRVEV